MYIQYIHKKATVSTHVRTHSILTASKMVHNQFVKLVHDRALMNHLRRIMTKSYFATNCMFDGFLTKNSKINFILHHTTEIITSKEKALLSITKELQIWPETTLVPRPPSHTTHIGHLRRRVSEINEQGGHGNISVVKLHCVWKHMVPLELLQITRRIHTG